MRTAAAAVAVTWFGKRHHPWELPPARPQRATEGGGGWDNTTQLSLHRIQYPYSPQGFIEGEIPDEVLAERQKRLLLEVSEHLEDDRLTLDVVHERFGDINGNLRRKFGWIE